MQYFEDSLYIRENFWRISIGTLYFVLGLFGITLNLITISILPELSDILRRPIIVILAAQFFSSFFQFLAVFVPAPAMIAMNRQYFMNNVLIDLPAFILVSGQCVFLLLTLTMSIYRNFSIVSVKLSGFIFHDNVLFVAIFIITCFSFYYSIDLCINSTIRRFNLSIFSWSMTDYEINSELWLLSIVLLVSSFFYILSISSIIYRRIMDKFFRKDPVSDEEEVVPAPKYSILSTMFLFIWDFLLVTICYLSIFLNYSNLSIVPNFLIIYYPLITSIFLQIHIRSALIYRTREIFQPNSINAPIVIKTPGRMM